MSTAFAGLVVNEHGQPILPPANNPEGRAAFFREFFNTAVGKRLAEVGVTAKAEKRIAEVGQKWYGSDSEITLEKLSAIVAALLDARDPALIAPPEVSAAPAPDSRPRNSDGTFKSEFQLFADTHSMTEIRDRANSDRAFGDWFRQQVQAQITTPGVFKVLGAPPERTATAEDRIWLDEFARAYQSTPIDQIRKPIAGYVALSNGKRYTVSELRAKVEECSRLGLI